MKKIRRRQFIISLFLLFILVIAVSVFIDINRNSTIDKIKRDKPKADVGGDIDDLLKGFISGAEKYDSSWLSAELDYINARYAGSDFKFVSLMRILYLYHDKLTPKDLDRVKDAVLNYKYWMTDSGEDSMCYWSENHQILYSTAEYLAGQFYPEAVFFNTGLTGEEHMERARKRLLIWMEQRWNYGFVEWYSNTYYKEDISPLANLVDFSDDEEIRIKAQIIIDLLIYDIASQSYRGTFVTSSGRGYASKKMSGESSSLRAVIEHLFGFDVDTRENGSGGMDLSFIHNLNYEMPSVFYNIAHDRAIAEIKASQGLNLSELKELDLIGEEDYQIMMQWAMESFSNPEIISNSIEFIDRNNMFRNSDLYGFRDVNYSILRKLNLLPIISRILSPQTNGTSIQRADTYNFRTPSFTMYTAQGYHPGEYGDQHHVFGVTLANNLSVFHNHPAVEEGKKGVHGNSPTYWVGYGHLPHSAQFENINLTIYRTPEKKSLMEKKIIDYTHAYFPRKYFDNVLIEGNLAFGRLDDTYVAFITTEDLYYREYEDSEEESLISGLSNKDAQGGLLKNAVASEKSIDYDLIQDGREVYWITEVSDKNTDGSFERFRDRIRSQAGGIEFNGEDLSYESIGNTFQLSFDGDFIVNDEVMNNIYKRYDSPYIQADENPRELLFRFGGKELYLNFREMIREFN